ncbi:MAG: alpha/beta hydrolase family protein [Myxococcota bacterium]
MHWLDRVVAKSSARRKHFVRGWGDLQLLDRLLDRGYPEEPEEIGVELSRPRRRRGGHVARRGRFRSPSFMSLPAQAQEAAFEWWLPDESDIEYPVCLFLAATGEQGFSRRRRLARPLLAEGISAVFLENPYYGARRPDEQFGTRLQTVVDQFTMVYAAVREARSLLYWLDRVGYREIGVSGFSMGGWVAMAAATGVKLPLAVSAFAVGLSPAPMYTRGALSWTVDWNAIHLGPNATDGRTHLYTLLDRVVEPSFGALADGSRAIIVGARDDGFVPAREVEALHRKVPSARLTWVDGGHVTTIARRRAVLRDAIRVSFDRDTQETDLFSTHDIENA